jgi:methionyl-tRNA formyltransferase
VVKLWQATVCDGRHAPAGTVLEAQGDRLVVACGRGALALRQVQRPGGKRQAVSAFVQARAGLLGQRLA